VGGKAKAGGPLSLPPSPLCTLPTFIITLFVPLLFPLQSTSPHPPFPFQPSTLDPLSLPLPPDIQSSSCPALGKNCYCFGPFGRQQKSGRPAKWDGSGDLRKVPPRKKIFFRGPGLAPRPSSLAGQLYRGARGGGGKNPTSVGGNGTEGGAKTALIFFSLPPGGTPILSFFGYPCFQMARKSD